MHALVVQHSTVSQEGAGYSMYQHSFSPGSPFIITSAAISGGISLYASISTKEKREEIRRKMYIAPDEYFSPLQKQDRNRENVWQNLSRSLPIALLISV